MRKTLFIFAAGFALILSAGFVSVPAAHAQPVSTSTPTAPSAEQKVQNDGSKTQTNFAESSVFKDTMAYMMSLLMTLFAWLLGVAMIVLDKAVHFTVVEMGKYINNLSAIGVAWRILRDVGNIALIFGFLAIGITTILGVDWYGGGKKMLPMLIVAAVFLNFSLFMTEAVIDTGNLFATQFYTQINGGVPAGGKTSILNETISSKIMNQLGLQTLYGDAITKPDVLKANNAILVGFFGILLFIIAAFVMFSLAFVLIARFVYLIYLMVIAPIGFAGLAIPQLKGLADKWWHDLFAQTLTAPVLLLLLYVALAVITDVNFLKFGDVPDYLGFTQNITDGSFNLTGFASMLLSFLVAMGLLLAVVISAKKLSAFGGEWATKTAGKLSFGVAAWGMNRTVGRAAYYTGRRLRQSETFNKFNAATGRILTRGFDRAATGSFDVRGASIAGGLGALNIDAGKAAERGFVGAREIGIKEHEEEAKRIETAHKEAFEETPEELEEIKRWNKAHEDAKKARTEAEKARTEAQARRNAAAAKVKEDEAEVARLTAIDKADRDAGRLSSVGAALRSAQQSLDTSKGSFQTAADNLGKATNNLKVAIADESKAEEKKMAAEKAPGNRLTSDTKKSKAAYAEGIDNLLNPITLVTYGPGTRAAARKIKDSLKEKPTKDKFLELAKKMAKEMGEEESKKEPKEEPQEEKKSEETH